MNTSQENFDSKKAYNQGFKQTQEILNQFGFKKYKTSFFARVVDGDIFQWIWFQKSAYGHTSGFRVNVAFNFLYQNYHGLMSYPGGGLGQFYNYQGDKWWKYNDDKEAKESFADVNEKLLSYAIPWLEKYNSSEKIKLAIDQGQANPLAGSPLFMDLDNLLYLYLKVEDLDKAKKYLTERINEIKKSIRISEPEKSAEVYIKDSGLREIEEYIETKNYKAIQRMLLENTRKCKEYHKIIDW